MFITALWRNLSNMLMPNCWNQSLEWCSTVSLLLSM